MFSKYACVVPLKEKKSLQLLMSLKLLQMILVTNQTKYGWIYVADFTTDDWNHENDIEMYSALNEGKSVVAKRFIRTLKNKINKYMTSVSIYW